MEGLEQENRVLREEVETMRAKINELAAMQTQVDELTELVRIMRVAQNVSPPPPINTQVEAGPSTIPGWTVTFNTPQQTILEGCPWGLLVTLGEVSRPYVSEAQIPTAQNAIPTPPPLATTPQTTIAYSALVVHAISQDNGPIFHSGSVGAYDRVHDLREKYDEMYREMQALRGKEVLKRDVHDSCLVPNVQIPHKFKLPDFEKYKGTSCPKDHLTMYARKMSTYANDHQVLIHYFQDSLTSPALKWYMNLNRAEIQTFNDLREAFVQQYKFNVNMALDRSDLQAMTQKDNETFKEYAQR